MFDIFLEIAPILYDQEYWAGLAFLWINTKLPGYRDEEWRNLFRSERPGRSAGLMNESERRLLDAVPDTLRVYRSATAETRWGMSWTLYRASARMYQIARVGHQQIWTAMITKADIIAFFVLHEVVVPDVKTVQLYRPSVNAWMPPELFQ